LRASNDVDVEREEIMRKSLLAGAALATIAMYAAPAAAELKFAPGEDGTFHLGGLRNACSRPTCPARR
jgi:hypothetical protein